MSFVGRNAELAALEALVAEVAAGGVGRAVFLEGPAGVGKTTLVSELLARVGTRGRVAIARGRCTQTFGGGEPYLPFVEALSDLADDSTEGFVSGATLSGMVKELAPYWLQVVPLVGGFLAATFATATEVQDRMKRAGAPSREALFVQYLELIRRLSAEAPLLLFLDDLHWADPSSIALLGYICRGISKLPVVVVGTLRGLELDHDDAALAALLLELERERIATRVRLAELDHDAIDALLETEFGGEVTARLHRWLVRTAGGNPLFVTELARLLRQSGGAVEVEGEWHLTDVAAQIEVPRSAESVIERRLQRLEAKELNLLQYASIDGNEFDSVVLSSLLGVDELELLDVLEPLERRHGLIESAGDIELPGGDVASQYRFRHALVQTVLYRQVVGKRRILLHRKAGELIETRWADSVDRVAARLARHFDEGRVRDRAHRYATMAADAAAAVFANWEAIEAFEVALRNAEEAEEPALRERLGDVYDRVGRYAAAIDEYRAAVERATDADAPLRLQRKIVTIERKAGFAPAPEIIKRVHALLESAPDRPAERCHLLLELTRLPDAPRTGQAEEAVRIAESLDDPLLLADALERLAACRLFIEGRTQDAFPHLRRALEIAFTIGDPVLLARYHATSGVAHAKLGRYADAQKDFEHLLADYERMGDPNGIAAACTNLGMVMLRHGAYAEAEEMLTRACHVHERNDRASIVESLFGLAERARLQGEAELARERFEALLSAAQRLQLWRSEALARAGLGMTLLAGGDAEHARRHADALRTLLAERTDWFEDRDLIETFLARIETAAGQGAEAIERLERAAAALETRDVYLWARNELERAELLAPIDRPAATALIARVRETVRLIQSPPLAARLARIGGSIAA